MTWLLTGYSPLRTNIGQHRDHSIPSYEIMEPGDGIFSHTPSLTYRELILDKGNDYASIIPRLLWQR
jgi:hypothetical protein